MIENVGGRNSGQFTVTCDDCGGARRFVVDDKGTRKEQWAELMGLMREAGWRNHKDGEQWQHLCSTCAPGSTQKPW